LVWEEQVEDELLVEGVDEEQLAAVAAAVADQLEEEEEEELELELVCLQLLLVP
jgi:ribosomal protein L6P/L9E